MASIAGYTVTHINTITTVFTPEPSCFAPSNFWLQTTGCTTYFPPFAPGPTSAYLTSLECPFTVLGPRQNGNAKDTSCYQYNAFTSPGTVYSDCPQSMTAVAEDTTSFDGGILLVQTTCCPAGAYDFAAPSGNPDASPTVIKGKTYSVVINTDSLCKASQVPQLQGQNLTITRSTIPSLVTATATWDGGALFATPQYIQKFLYQGSDSTTSTCFGGDNCPDNSNPLVSTPTPTSAPTDRYIPPPSHPVTQFTPAPSCLAKSNLHLVSSRCHLVEPKDLMTRSPPWLHCTVAQAGSPNPVQDKDCYQGVNQHTDRTTGSDGTTTFYSACPLGYTIAHSSTHYPYDEGMLDEYGPTKIFSATHSAFVCCPTQYPFFYADEDAFSSTTTNNGLTFSLQFHRMPECKATAVWGLANREVVMTLTAQDADLLVPRRGVPPRRLGGRQRVLGPAEPPRPTTPPKVTTTRWDVVEKTLWAEAQHYSYVVFHETYTCYEDCDRYFTYSYHNTDPGYTPTGEPRTVKTRPTPPPPPPPPEPTFVEDKSDGILKEEEAEEGEEDSDPAVRPTEEQKQSVELGGQHQGGRGQGQGEGGQQERVENTEGNREHAYRHGANAASGSDDAPPPNLEAKPETQAQSEVQPEVQPPAEKKDEVVAEADGAAKLYPGVKAEGSGTREQAGGDGTRNDGGGPGAGAGDFYPGVGAEEGVAKKEEPIVAAPGGGGDKKTKRRRR